MRQKKLYAAIALLIVLACVLAPGAGASTPPPQAASAAHAAGRPAAGEARLLSSTADGVTFEVTAPWEMLRTDLAAAKGYTAVSMPGWDVTSQAGSPALPFVARAIGVPFGADLSISVDAGPAHTLTLVAPVLPAATQKVASAPPSGAVGPTALPKPERVIEADAAVYGVQAAYPGTLASITSDGMVRQQRVAGVAVYPVQYEPLSGQLTVYEWLDVTVSFGSKQPRPAVSKAARESVTYERELAQTLLNYDGARAWRQTADAAAQPNVAGTETLSWAPPSSAWRIKVREDGLYRLTYAQLQAAGLPVTALNPQTFQMYNLGGEVAVWVDGEADGRFDSSDSIVFYGQATASKYTRDNVYWLTYGQAAGLRMAARSGAPGGAAQPASYPAARHLETNAMYLSNTPGDDNLDRWLWDYLYPPSRPSWTTSFGLAAPDAGAGATLTVAMLGSISSWINPDHHAQVYLNGVLVGDVRWDGIAWLTPQFTVPQNVLAAGNNTLAVNGANDTGVGYDVIYIDWAELRFANTFRAESNELPFRFETAGAWTFPVDGFDSAAVDVYDVTNPATAKRIDNVSVASSALGYSALFQDTVAAPTSYRAVGTSAYRTVQAIERDTASNLRATTNAADYILITPRAFWNEAGSLRSFRASQGLRALFVDVQDIYDEFNGGVFSPQAIHDFLAYAYANWQTPAPSMVVLMGDGHYDPRNYLGYGRPSYVPPYLAALDPWIGEVAADNRYVTLAGADNLPDMMLGRISVNTSSEASIVVNKIINYEQNPVAGAWRQQVLAIADNADSAGNFPLLSDNALANLPASVAAQKVYYLVTHATADSARAAIRDGINTGKLIVNFIGHGGIDLWAADTNQPPLLSIVDIPLLANGAMLPVVLPMTCYDGYYVYPYANSSYDAMAEVFTRANGKGAVASWSPTGLGDSSGHDYLDQGFLQAVFQNDLRTLGQATNAGKLKLWATGASRELMDTYLLFGDPATTIALPDGSVPTPTPTPVATPTPAPSSMHMGATSLAYKLAKGKYTVTATSTVLDAANRPVPSAMVYGTWTLPDGATQANQAASNSRTGKVTFSLTSPLRGAYAFCVTNVVKSGWGYDPSKNVETCKTITVQ